MVRPLAPLPLSERLLSVREAARVLGLSRASVYRLCERGELPHVRLSNVVRIDPAELARFIKGRSHTVQ